jgi:hypothetical protein
VWLASSSSLAAAAADQRAAGNSRAGQASGALMTWSNDQNASTQPQLHLGDASLSCGQPQLQLEDVSLSCGQPQLLLEDASLSCGQPQLPLEDASRSCDQDQEQAVPYSVIPCRTSDRPPVVPGASRRISVQLPLPPQSVQPQEVGGSASACLARNVLLHQHSTSYDCRPSTKKNFSKSGDLTNGRKAAGNYTEAARSQLMDSMDKYYTQQSMAEVSKHFQHNAAAAAGRPRKSVDWRVRPQYPESNCSSRRTSFALLNIGDEARGSYTSSQRRSRDNRRMSFGEYRRRSMADSCRSSNVGNGRGLELLCELGEQVGLAGGLHSRKSRQFPYRQRCRDSSDTVASQPEGPNDELLCVTAASCLAAASFNLEDGAEMVGSDHSDQIVLDVVDDGSPADGLGSTGAKGQPEVLKAGKLRRLKPIRGVDGASVQGRASGEEGALGWSRLMQQHAERSSAVDDNALPYLYNQGGGRVGPSGAGERPYMAAAEALQDRRRFELVAAAQPPARERRGVRRSTSVHDFAYGWDTRGVTATVWGSCASSLEWPLVANLPSEQTLQCLRKAGGAGDGQELEPGAEGAEAAAPATAAAAGFQGADIGQTCSTLMSGCWLWARRLLLQDLGTFE